MPKAAVKSLSLKACGGNKFSKISIGHSGIGLKFEEAHKAVKERKGKDEKIILYTKGYAAERAGCRAGISGGKFGLRAPGRGSAYAGYKEGACQRDGRRRRGRA